MSFGDYYVAEISWFPGNPVYKALVMERNRKIGLFDILTGSEAECIGEDVTRLHIFKLIARIPEMNDTYDTSIKTEDGPLHDYTLCDKRRKYPASDTKAKEISEDAESPKGVTVDLSHVEFPPDATEEEKMHILAKEAARQAPPLSPERKERLRQLLTTNY